jgi:thiamine-monophosphate kinase
MLTGGEDHALLATFPAVAAIPEPFRVIGRVRAGGPEITVDGIAQQSSGGFRHFSG